MNSPEGHAPTRDTLAELLNRGLPPGELPVPPELWGVGGMHGGLALALMASSAQNHVGGASLRSITGHFHRPIRDRVSIVSQLLRAGRSAIAVQTTASDAGGICVTSTAIFGPDQPAGPAHAPSFPRVPGPDDLPTLDELEGKPPVLEQVELRPVGDFTPYASASRAELTAWVRLGGSAAPVGTAAVVFLLDALPPSYMTVLSDRRPVPTLELAAHLSGTRATSPWVLARAVTVGAGAGGWVTETIDVWDVSGLHLGRGQQLRLALAAR